MMRDLLLVVPIFLHESFIDRKNEFILIPNEAIVISIDRPIATENILLTFTMGVWCYYLLRQRNIKTKQ